mmetsp:Transcript_26346/g.64055  ORF Transcript_26346/g.64055 Transcript_26346/m.64055 type:complete len:96 (-) Transcript_26346:64-351(-)
MRSLKAAAACAEAQCRLGGGDVAAAAFGAVSVVAGAMWPSRRSCSVASTLPLPSMLLLLLLSSRSSVVGTTDDVEVRRDDAAAAVAAAVVDAADV